MVNKIVLEYLRVNRGNYKLPDLKKKVVSSGYTVQDFDGALAELNKQSGGNAPSVGATINKINKTNLVEKKPVGVKPAVQKPVVQKKSRKWLWIILGIVALVLIGVGISLLIFWDKIVGLF